MKMYNVLVEKESYLVEECWIEVEANSDEAARDLAIDLACEDGDWRFTDEKDFHFTTYLESDLKDDEDEEVSS